MNYLRRSILLSGAFLVNLIIMQSNACDLVDICSVSNIPIEIRYAMNNNFTGSKVYSQARCFLRQQTADKLIKVQRELKKYNLRLKIFDGYRPRSVQYKLWRLVPDYRYVANPDKGSRHNRGAAVDLTLIDSNNKELEMGTDFDDFSAKAHRNCTDISETAWNNRKFLENIMVKHGFVGLPTEWWHFDDVDWKNYQLLDISFEELASKRKSKNI